ncbi:TIGR03618 family F420-dependent PPOX class oxidoreductase [Streptomyces johnsoniae]|uniref:TIGR03618 family F420-dependent PPOX class oxidoreductase n=2 Tax=Streptomyces TaxID=1883 RepID=A0ABU2SCE8_9ACTN|nr:TIGR03618 family F420-dependent PPOX class oxidoreductase [Streptomyces sp. DSM 41886]MDT0446652.1 TIGR03618 family F420-dependent PPOX class oxidoreductase [Streptomyces sp. DSM 41886]
MAFALPESARRLIESPALAHVVSLNPDGSPHVTGVWVGMDGGDIVFASMYAWRKTQNLQQDERVALTIEGDGFHGSGLREYLVVYGTAEVTEGGAFSLLRRLARTYMGQDAQFPPDQLSTLGGYVMRVRIEKIGGVGPWTAGPPGLPEDAQTT